MIFHQNWMVNFPTIARLHEMSLIWDINCVSPQMLPNLLSIFSLFFASIFPASVGFCFSIPYSVQNTSNTCSIGWGCWECLTHKYPMPICLIHMDLCNTFKQSKYQIHLSHSIPNTVIIPSHSILLFLSIYIFWSGGFYRKWINAIRGLN